MRSIAKSLILLLLCLQFATAKELTVAFAQHNPPYIFKDNTGILVDIVRAALAYGGHTMKPLLTPIGRAHELFEKKQIDVATTLQSSQGYVAYYSIDYIQYHNYVFSLKPRKFKIETLDDLQDKSIIAFQKAQQVLGRKFQEVVAKNSHYREVANQDTQIPMLLLGRTDLIVMDESIFKHYWNEAQKNEKIYKNQAWEKIDLFEPTEYKAAFQEKEIRDDFNRGIEHLMKSGEYQKIIKKYSAL